MSANTNRFDYMFRGGNRPEALAILKKAGIKFVEVNVGGVERWPGLLLPNGQVLAIAADDEGNGAGAIQVLNTKEWEVK